MTLKDFLLKYSYFILILLIFFTTCEKEKAHLDNIDIKDTLQSNIDTLAPVVTIHLKKSSSYFYATDTTNVNISVSNGFPAKMLQLYLNDRKIAQLDFLGKTTYDFKVPLINVFYDKTNFIKAKILDTLDFQVMDSTAIKVQCLFIRKDLVKVSPDNKVIISGRIGNINTGKKIKNYGILYSKSYITPIDDFKETFTYYGEYNYILSFSKKFDYNSTYYCKNFLELEDTIIYSDVYNFTTAKSDSGYFVDTRDGEKYKWVKIGNQIWMAENLRYYIDGSIFIDKEYGVLYPYDGITNICPKGWHVPSSSEWTSLFSNAGGYMYAASNLREEGFDKWELSYIGGKDLYGFKALPTGISTSGEFISGFGRETWFWNNNARIDNSNESVLYHIFGFETDKSNYTTGYFGFKNLKCCVRCIKD